MGEGNSQKESKVSLLKEGGIDAVKQKITEICSRNRKGYVILGSLLGGKWGNDILSRGHGINKGRVIKEFNLSYNGKEFSMVGINYIRKSECWEVAGDKEIFLYDMWKD